jgi:FkbM family methyltransferase
MLIPCSELSLVYGVRPHGILHVGAHEAEELESYRSYGWGPVIWVEMLPEKFERLKQRFEGDSNNTVIHAACWDSDGDNQPLFRANNGQSSSVLSPQLHLVVHPHVSFVEEEGIRTSRLDSILPKDASFDFINFDIQGAELRALRGLGEFLDRVKWAYLEINERPLYKGCALLPELDAFLKERRFVRIATCMVGLSGWGDALYMNTSHLSEWSLLLLKLRLSIRSWWQLLRSRAKVLLHKETRRK